MKAILLLFISVGLFQTQQIELDPDFNAITEFFIPAVLGALAVLFADAKKWVFSGKWSWKEFFKTKALPFLFTVLLAVVLYLILAFLPLARPFVEIISGYELIELTAASLMGAAAAIIDGFMKPTVEQVEQQKYY